ncbi:hypothetical protein CJ195_22320 [Bacillus sp. UMB0899]|nr:hypothetical protein CJ195_22320 [Bacillus sp. UMB0899]
MMNKIIKKHKDRIERVIFNGQELRQIENSFYQVLSESILLVSGEPDTKHYLFTMNPVYFEQCESVIFLCGNDLCAFKIPTSELKDLPFCVKGNGRPKTMIDFDEKTSTWYLTFNTDSNGNNKSDIEPFLFDLRTEEEKMYIGLAIQSQFSAKIQKI